ncbi:MAG TPA: phosphoenolpyruvate--protein phosphotransferase [Polyangia bacterium]|jgi:phosphotransferase system enzyme I (PtsI)|nr:phosphoenolpyruvate--protein phosphotransferase [Polyangia bacterium]
MIRLRGLGASRGIAIGPAYLTEVSVSVAERRILRHDRQSELARLTAAIETAEQQLDRLRRQLTGQGGTALDLIELHRAILRSPELAGEAQRFVESECFSAESAVTRALEQIRVTFARLDDPYFRDRAADFEAAADRLLRVLIGLPELRPEASSPRDAVAVGVELGPLDLFGFHHAGVAAVASESGGTTSHAAIIARALGVPYVVRVQGVTAKVRPGAPMIVDGIRGEVIIDPDESVLRAFRERSAAERDRERRMQDLRALPSITRDGVAVHLGANVESLVGVSAAVAAGAESVGLFRTEFLYLERADLPSEQEQFDDAVSAIRSAKGLPITFRTLDIGADKLPASVKVFPGKNPALGIRSTRFSLLRPEIFKRQLRALYRASAVGPVRIMFPLVSGVGELRQLRALSDQVRAELDAEHASYDAAVALGVMVETPSAALTADHLARHSDFLSVGTNDLIQYAFAADRENGDVTHLHQPLHPAVLRTLKSLMAMAAAADAPISICGDMAGDPFLTWVLIGLGFRELSMDRDRIPLVKSVVRGSSIAEAEAFVREALAMEDENDVAEALRSRLDGRFDSELEGFIPSREL